MLIALPGTTTLSSWPGEGVATSSSFAISRETGVTGKELRIAANEVGEFSSASGDLGGIAGALWQPGLDTPVGNAPGTSAGAVHALRPGRTCCMRRAAMENPSECFSLSTFA